LILNDDAILNKNKQEEVTMEKAEKEKKEKPWRNILQGITEMALDSPVCMGSMP